MKRLTRPRGLPLRAKLIALTASVLTSVMVIFGVVLYIGIGRVLLDNTAQGLRASAGVAINERLNGPRQSRDNRVLPVPGATPGRQGGPGSPPSGQDDAHMLTDIARFLTTRDTAALTTDPAGATVGDGPALVGTTTRAPALDPSTYRAVATANEERHFRYQTAEGPVLVELVPLVPATANPSSPLGVLELSTSLESIDTFLSRLRLLFLTVTLLAVAATVVLTIPLVAGLLRPLRRMAGTSRAIAAGDLTRRVPVPRGGDELTDLAHAFNEMVGRLEAAFATQRRFIADASHELRSPLAALGGGVEMLQLGADQSDPAARARLLRLMGSEIGRMSRLVDDLLTLTRFDANPLAALHRTPVDVTALAREVVDETRLLSPDRDVRLDTPPETTITVAGDADRLRQALLNLCANARAYTPPDGTITIGVHLVGGDAVLTVADTGDGIPPEDLPRVWDRFYRADAARARHAGQGGLGLGLAIVHAIVEAHGGATSITSAPGDGTTVTMTIPGASAKGSHPAVALPVSTSR